MRFRHDQLGDWGRMQRQQLFLRELKRQALRWQNVFKLPKLIDSMTSNTISDVSSIKKLLGLVELGLGANTQHIYQTHLVGEPVVINGADELQASPAEVAAVVDEFMHPLRPPVQQIAGESQPKTSFSVTVSNGGAAAGSAAGAAGLLAVQGYTTAVAGNVLQGDSKATLVYATQAYAGNARALAAMLVPSRVVTVARAPGVQPGVAVVLGASYTGTLVLPKEPPPVRPSRCTARKTSRSGAPSLTRPSSSCACPPPGCPGSPMTGPCRAPTRSPPATVAGPPWSWSAPPAAAGTGTSKRRTGSTPPAIASPDGSSVVKGVRYLEFYDGAKLHMVAWKVDKTLYWVANTLDNELANDTMMATRHVVYRREVSRRLVPRRLDPWAALLLGVSVTLGVIILLATPGPWHKVVPAVATRPPLAPPPPPRDIAVFLKGPGREGCAGALWLHIDYEQSASPPSSCRCAWPATCRAPDSCRCSRSSTRPVRGSPRGPWATGCRSRSARGSRSTRRRCASRFPVSSRPRPRACTVPALPLTGVWALHQAPLVALQRQMRYLQFVLKGGLADEINLDGFVNYVLGSNDVSTTLRLQAASAIGAALDTAGPGDLVTSSLPAIVHRRGSYERWSVSPAALLSLRQSLAFDARRPIYQPGADRAARRAHGGRRDLAAGAFHGDLSRRVRASAARVRRRRRDGRPAHVTHPPRRRARSAGRRPATPLGVVVALGRSAKGAVPAKRARRAAERGARDRPCLRGAGGRLRGAGDRRGGQQRHRRPGQARRPAAVAGRGRARRAAALRFADGERLADCRRHDRRRAPRRRGRRGCQPCADGGATTGPARPRARRPARARDATPAAPAPRRRPPPRLTATAGAGPLTTALVTAWARLDAATFVRAVQPAFFAPRLAATGSG